MILCLTEEDRCSSDELLTFHGPVSIVELGRELKNSFMGMVFYGRPSRESETYCLLLSIFSLSHD